MQRVIIIIVITAPLEQAKHQKPNLLPSNCFPLGRA
jgi:hypothetical protein